MRLTLSGFGGIVFETSIELESLTLPNGAGKTTLLNAYIFALTGKTQTGFTPINIGCDRAEVVLEGVPGIGTLRRTIVPGKTSLYVNGEFMTQSAFESKATGAGINIPFAALCADANVLVGSALTSDDLRALLVSCAVGDRDELRKLRKQRIDLIGKLKAAKVSAVLTVAPVVRTCEPLTEAEQVYYARVMQARKAVDRGIERSCPTCGKVYTEDEIRESLRALRNAEYTCEYEASDFERIQLKRENFEAEETASRDTERIISAASRARTDVAVLEDQIAHIDKEIHEADSAAVRAELPDGVDIITRSESGKNVCTMTYKGVPLKSINHAKRVEICVQILERAREEEDLRDFPIIVDNAESVQGLGGVHNLIRLTVG